MRSVHTFPTRRSSDLFIGQVDIVQPAFAIGEPHPCRAIRQTGQHYGHGQTWSGLAIGLHERRLAARITDRKSTSLNSSHVKISYAVFCLKKKKWTNMY